MLNTLLYFVQSLSELNMYRYKTTMWADLFMDGGERIRETKLCKKNLMK